MQAVPGSKRDIPLIVLAGEDTLLRSELARHLMRAGVRIDCMSYSEYARAIRSLRPTVLVCIAELGQLLNLGHITALSFPTPVVVIGADPQQEWEPDSLSSSVFRLPAGYSTEQQALLTAGLARAAANGEHIAAPPRGGLWPMEDAALSSPFPHSVPSSLQICSLGADNADSTDPARAHAALSPKEPHPVDDDDSCERTLPSVTSYVRPVRPGVSSPSVDRRGKHITSIFRELAAAALDALSRYASRIGSSRRAVFSQGETPAAAEPAPDTKRSRPTQALQHASR